MSDAVAVSAAYRLFSEVCRTRQIDIKPLCGGRVLVLSKRGITANVYGWDFGVNSATALLVCRNKAACSALLQDRGIPCVPHEVFYRPDREVFGFVYDASWSRMIEFFGAHPAGVVCKPNDLSRGIGVRRVSSVPQLEKAAYEVFRFSRELSLSPFVSIDAEYRVVVFNGRCRLMYVKRLPVVMGDGASMLGELIAAAHDQEWTDVPLGGLLEDVEQTRRITYVPARDELVRVGWRHNFTHGARAELLDAASPELRQIVDMAEGAARALGVVLAAVDVVNNAGNYHVLEVNTGILTTHLLQQLPSARPIVKELFGAVVEHLFELVEASERGSYGHGGLTGGTNGAQ
jgi:D-alanine-D-alanine ligase-like ATP-grasp enzyme